MRCRPRCIAVREAAHPTPDAAGVDATGAMLALVADLTADDLVLCLVSGGGSALFEQPVDGHHTRRHAGDDAAVAPCRRADHRARIRVRKHLSAVKGGQLARRVAPATLVALILSDVVGDPLDVIASGPTVPDPTTFADALTCSMSTGCARRCRPLSAPIWRRARAVRTRNTEGGRSMLQSDRTRA